jgi:hypothetical protein
MAETIKSEARRVESKPPTMTAKLATRACGKHEEAMMTAEEYMLHICTRQDYTVGLHSWLIQLTQRNRVIDSLI